MDFAQKILNKYGWKEGEGLGKNNHGIAKPIKPSLKFDNAGFGADQAASDFNNHWWERVFNEAAQNVEIKAEENGTIKMDLKDVDNEVEITTKGYSVKKLKKANAKIKANAPLYNNFMQASTLLSSSNEVENPFKVQVDEIAVTPFKTLTDEELFQACGGRTAHKGARHGLKLSGKLLRLEQQEKEMLAKMLAKQKEPLAEKCQENLVDTESKKKRKKKHVSEEPAEKCEEVSAETKSKKKKKIKEHITEETAEQYEEISTETKSKKKKKNKLEKLIDTETLERASAIVTGKPQKKRKKPSEETIVEELNIVKAKKKKKHE